MAFSEYDIRDLTGRTALVTGATGGLGWEASRMLAEAGASVILTGRNEDKGAEAVDRIRRLFPAAKVHFEVLDLSSLDDIKAFSDRTTAGGRPIDIQINNAGLMAPPDRGVTREGFERQFGVNHLGHFALTGRLLPLLVMKGAARVVTISSGVAAFGRINFADLQSETTYRPATAYSQSKLANLLFARGLQRRSNGQGWGLISVAAHPGHARTDLIANGLGRPTGLTALLIHLLQAVASHDAAARALPGVLAATGAEVRPLDYYAPRYLLQQRGPPRRINFPKAALDDDAADRLWRVSEQLSGVRYQAATGR